MEGGNRFMQQRQNTLTADHSDAAISVLIVDDDDAVRLVASEMLAAQGCEVVCASSGKECLEILDNLSFDLVLLDVGMPDMTGVEVYHLLRAGRPAQKVAFLTGYAMGEITDLDDELLSIVAKPFSMDSLAEAIKFSVA